MAYTIDYSPEAEDHLWALSARQRQLVADAVDRQLVHEPCRITRHRKPLRPNPLGDWEIRIGDLRVYYNVEEEPIPMVLVNAIGIKMGNRVRVGDEVMDL